jgi:hypothetical protein
MPRPLLADHKVRLPLFPAIGNNVYAMPSVTAFGQLPFELLVEALLGL